jgi:hypothetical protein
MTRSQAPKESYPITENVMGARAKGIRGLVIPMAIGAIVILIALIFNALFPREYWQSRELEQNRAKWESQHITHYRMSLTLPFFISNYDRMPLTVEVKNGKVISVTDVHGETVFPENDGDLTRDYPELTIPGLFSYVQQTYLEKPASIEVTYDPVLGYPTTIYVDPYVEPCCQDFTYDVRDFKALP